MKNLFLMLLAAFLLTVTVNAQNGESVLKLQEVKKIFVGELGRTDSADIVREKIKLRLNQTGRFIVTNRQDEADAVLTGTVIVEKFVEGDAIDIDTKNKGVGVFLSARRQNR